MKIKDGFLALAIAAALSTPAAFAQDQSRSSEPPQSSSSSDATAPGSSSAMSSPSAGRSSSMGMSQTAQGQVPPPVDNQTVRSVQQALSEQGHKVKADGVWGEKTHQALMDFQREKNLKASGQLDAETFAALHLGGESQTASAGGRSGSASSSGSSQ